ncbi:MAG TPA: serine protease [Acidimicrobiia bacterium]|nr:serine protease [Acidimicrobiia bacterium]
MKLLARTFAAVVTCATAAVPLVAAQAPPAAAAPTWAPAATAPIHPGVQTITDGAQCTANFVFYDASNTVYIGQAAHCSGTGGATETNGCDSGSLPIGTPVEVGGASQPGTMVYNSWLAMQAAGETNPDTCAFNDLALIRLNSADFGKVNPSIPFWGGPAGIDTNGTAAGENVYSYGNSSLRGGVSQLSPKQGVSLGDEGNGWSHNVYTATPGIPGDSGSAFLNSAGAALGVLSTVQIAPLAGSNGVGDVSREINYMSSHSSLGVQLANGTQPFNPNIVANLLGALGL